MGVRGVSSGPIFTVFVGKIVKFLEFGLRLWKFTDILRLPFVRRWVDECVTELRFGSSPSHQTGVFDCMESHANMACYPISTLRRSEDLMLFPLFISKSMVGFVGLLL